MLSGRAGSPGARRRQISRWSVGGLLGCLVGLALTALVGLGTLSYLQVGSLAEDRVQVEHSYRILDRTAALQGLFEAAETGQRDYLITGRESYLQPYADSLARIGPTTSELTALTSNDPVQQATLARLGTPVLDKLAELAETVALRRSSGFDAARPVVATRGEVAMTTIRVLLDHMRQREDQLLRGRLAAGRRDTRQTRQYIALGAVLGTVTLAGGAWRLARGVSVSARQITAAARRVSAGRVDEPAPVTGPRELAEMADAVNASLREIARTRDEAVSATAAKSVFLSTMSHEIRTPMKAVIGMTELLLETALSAGQRDLVETARDSGDAMMMIINDILDSSKIESGELELTVASFSVRECVEGAMALVAVAAQEKNVELVADVDASCPVLVRGDKARLRQVLTNLLSNAVTFTAAGDVVLRASAQRPDDVEAGRLVLRIDVTDTGIGIPADRIYQLFQPFTQIDSSSTRIHGGTGLGLAISHRLAQAMRGDLSVTSLPGVGSTFTMTAELEEDVDRRARDVPDTRAAFVGVTVLVVDDNAALRRVLAAQLRLWGMVPTVVATAGEALELYAAGRRFDVGLLDLVMPRGDGIELAREIRRAPGGATVPLLLLAGRQLRAAPEQGLFAAIVSKPVRHLSLQRSLQALFAPVDMALLTVETAGGLRAGDPAAGTVPLRVLLAEDNPTNQLVTQLSLARLGHLVDTVADGRAAVDAVLKTVYDVVLMDVHMPVMDGLEATRLIRAEMPVHQQPRIVAVTASVLEDREDCSRAGMDGYLSKPVRERDMREVLAAVDGSRAARSSADGSEPAATAARRRALLQRLDDLRDPDHPDDDALLVRLLRSFCAQAPAALALIGEAIGNDDAEAVGRLAHSGQGSAHNLGASALGTLYEELEAQGRAGRLTDAAEVLRSAEHELALVCTIMTAMATDLEAADPGGGPPGPGSADVGAGRADQVSRT